MSKVHKSPIEKGIAKVPVVMQMEAVECGAACLTMLMSYFGKWVSLEQIREACGVSRDGSNAGNIIKAARNYGFDADGFKAEPETLRKQGSFPCIIHWNLDHFVVLCGFKGDRAYLNDPALGSYSVSMEEFDESLTGIVIFVEPPEDFVPEGQPKSMWSFVKKRLKGNGKIMAFVLVITAVLSLLGLIMPGFSRVFTDNIISGTDPSWFLPFIFIISAVSILIIAASWINAVYSLKLGGKLDAIGNTSYMWKVLNLPMRFFSQRTTGDIRIRQSTNSSIANTLISTLAPLAVNGVMLVFYLVVMLKNSWVLTIVGVASILINAFISFIISKRRVDYTRVMMRDSARLEAATASGFELVETLKASGAEKAYLEKWTGYQADVYEQNYKYLRGNLALESIPVFISSAANIAVMIIGIYLVICGRFSVGGILAFQGFISNFMQPAQTFLSASQTIIEMRTDMERIDDVMEYPSDNVFAPESDESEEDGVQKLSGHIEMKNVTFGYSPLAEPLIRNLNLEIMPGMQIALVGASGCGKSTISKLLSGLYAPWEGTILFDGKPLNQIKKSTFSASLAVVDQDTILFEDTISDNIKLWDRTIENFEVILAARDAQIHDDISARPGGYQCRMTEGGSNFSGGQCQRMEIARVLAQDPSIIIMDEATSALDAQTEYEVVEAVKKRGITGIVIAHRLSTIRDCNLIIVLDRGVIVGMGKHEELMQENEYYRTLILSD